MRAMSCVTVLGIVIGLSVGVCGCAKREDAPKNDEQTSPTTLGTTSGGSLPSVQSAMKELGFEFPEMVGYFYSFGENEGWLDYKCTRKADGATLTFYRKLTQPLDSIPDLGPSGPRPTFQAGAKRASEVGDLPDSGYRISAPHEENSRRALLELAKRISPHVATALKERLEDYTRTKRDSVHTVGILSVSVNKEGLTVESGGDNAQSGR